MEKVISKTNDRHSFASRCSVEHLQDLQMLDKQTQGLTGHAEVTITRPAARTSSPGDGLILPGVVTRSQEGEDVLKPCGRTFG